MSKGEETVRISKNIIDLIENHRIIQACLEDLARATKNTRVVLLQLCSQGYGDADDCDDLKYMTNPQEIRVMAMNYLEQIVKEIGEGMLSINKKETDPNGQSLNK